MKRHRFLLAWIVPVVANLWLMSENSFHPFSIHRYLPIGFAAEVSWLFPLCLLAFDRKGIWFLVSAVATVIFWLVTYYSVDPVSAVVQRTCVKIWRGPLDRLAHTPQDLEFDPPKRVGPFMFRRTIHLNGRVLLIFPPIENSGAAGLSRGDGCGFGGEDCHELTGPWKSFASY